MPDLNWGLCLVRGKEKEIKNMGRNDVESYYLSGEFDTFFFVRRSRMLETDDEICGRNRGNRIQTMWEKSRELYSV